MPAESSARTVRRLARVVSQWQSNWRYRRDLRRLCRLGPHFLADVGLPSNEAHIEAAKPFWKT